MEEYKLPCKSFRFPEDCNRQQYCWFDDDAKECRRRNSPEYRMHTLRRIELIPDARIVGSDGIEIETNASILKRSHYFDQALEFNNSNTIYVDEPADMFRFVLYELEDILDLSLLPDDLDFLRRLLLVFDKYLIYSKVIWEKVNGILSDYDYDAIRPWIPMYVYFNNGIDLLSLLSDARVRPQNNSLEAKDTDGNTILMNAILKEDVEFVQILINAGVNVDNGNYNSTPLSFSIAMYNAYHNINSIDIIKVLLKAGAGPSISEIPDIIYYALSASDEELMRYILFTGTNGAYSPEYDIIASERGCMDVINYLTYINADIRPFLLEHVLLLASQNGHFDVVQYLVSVGTNVHANDDSALQMASENGHIDVVRYLVSMGANVHADDDYALMMASENGHLDVVKYLVSMGANVHADGEYALISAFDNGHHDVVDYLVSVGADPGVLEN